MSADPTRPTKRQSLPSPLTNPDAEAVTLGSALYDEKFYAEAASFLRPEHFADPLNAWVWRQIGATVAEGRTPNSLIQTAKATDPAVAGYLVSLVGMSTPGMFARDVAVVVLDLAQRRSLIRTAEEMQAAARDLEQSADAAIADGVRMLHGLAQGSPGGEIGKRALGLQIAERLTQPAVFYRTGLSLWDEAMGGGLFPEKVIGIAARTKVGKTTLLGTVSHNLNWAGVPHVYCAGEMTPREIEERNLARELDINSMVFLRGRDNPQAALVQARVKQKAEQIPDVMRYEGRSAFRSLNSLEDAIGRHIVRHGIVGVIVDYWQLVGGRKGGESEVDHLGRIAGRFEEIAKRTGLWFLVSAQQNQQGNTRGGEGLKLSCDQYYDLHREEGESDAWMELKLSRYTPYRNVGVYDYQREVIVEPGLYLNKNGPWFEDGAAFRQQYQADLDR